MITFALALLALAFALGLFRVTVGPALADRAVAADVCFYALVAGFALLAVRQGAQAFLDVVLVATLLGFLATVALARLVDRDRS